MKSLTSRLTFREHFKGYVCNVTLTVLREDESKIWRWKVIDIESVVSLYLGIYNFIAQIQCTISLIESGEFNAKSKST